MAFNNVVPGNNWETPYSDYTPFRCDIEDITNAQYAVVTFTTDHPYMSGELLSLRVSLPYGMTEVNNKTSRVLEITNDTVTLELDTLGFTPFIFPPSGEVVFPAVCVPAGSGIVPFSPIPMTNLQDCFDNAPN